MSSGEDEEVGELDQIDVYHSRQESLLKSYGAAEEYSSNDESSEEEEVMALDLSSSSEPDLSSSNKLGDMNEPLSLKSWGRKMSTYYEEGDEGESESIDGELEEREALHLQALQATLLSQSDFDIQLSGLQSSQKDLDEDTEVVPTNLASLNPLEKHLLVDRNHPGLVPIIDCFKSSFGTAIEGLDLLHDSYSAHSHIKVITELSVFLNLSYSLNSMYYLLLKTGKVSVVSHPVTSTLLKLQKLLGKLEKATKLSQNHKGRKFRHLSASGVSSNEMSEDPLGFYHRVATQKLSKRENSSRRSELAFPVADLQPLEEKRAITYQISRNKGLGMTGKRQLRNPRVKHRIKYKKALIRRKSQILPIAREMNKYAGEITGIKANLSRSTVIQS